MRISKRLREEAAMVCAIVASNDTSLVAAALWVSGTRPAGVLVLAEQACCEASRRRREPWWVTETYAEAECLLRTGWTP